MNALMYEYIDTLINIYVQYSMLQKKDAYIQFSATMNQQPKP